MNDHYILNGREMIPATLFGWARWLQTNDNHIGQARVRGMWVSTIFLGIDHGWPGGTPLFFETMIFKGWRVSPLDGRRYQVEHFSDRYATYDEAARSHKAIVRFFRLSKRQRKRPTCKRGGVLLELSAD